MTDAMDQWLRWKALNNEATLHGKPMSSSGAIIRADAAIDEVLAELAALKGRRCETCAHWNFWLGPLGPNRSICGNEVFDGVADEGGHNPPADFACSRWHARRGRHLHDGHLA